MPNTPNRTASKRLSQRTQPKTRYALRSRKPAEVLPELLRVVDKLIGLLERDFWHEDDAKSLWQQASLLTFELWPEGETTRIDHGKGVVGLEVESACDPRPTNDQERDCYQIRQMALEWQKNNDERFWQSVRERWVIELANIRDSLRRSGGVDDLEPSPRKEQAPASVRLRRRRLERLAKAMMLVQDHPEWSDREIAKQIGMASSTLSRSPTYQRAAKMARGTKDDRPRGYIVKNPETGRRDVEAWTADDKNG